METITKADLLNFDPGLQNRPYQIHALLSIFQYPKCLVKMFCGTGKSRIITNVIFHEKKELSVVVFPSLALISQYSTDYMTHVEYNHHFKKHKMMNVSSESLTTIDSTTSPKEIQKFLKFKSPKIILVTYQSFQVLLDCLKGKTIGLVCYDEAHHVVSPEYQKLVFDTDYFEKEVFFTATPKNENGITMFDRDDPERNMCGTIVYNYSYLQGLMDEVLNAFEICVDMYTENTNTSIYEAMARAILARSTSRVLSFHSGVNGESNTNVWNFVKEAEFQTAFEKVQKTEFPEKAGYYKKITFKGIDGNTPSHERKAILYALGETPMDEIYIISSCETIGEGVDTKKANMCIFADPKASIVKIIQNIGRVVRRNKDHPLSTILIPCWINMENYADANGDRTKQDDLIRENMRSDNGDYSSILNVLGALNQEDEELYEMCLNYPNRKVKDESMASQGFRIVETNDDDEDDDSGTYSIEEVEMMKNDGEPLEIHTNETIERFNEDSSSENITRLYHDEEEDVYKPIVRTDCEEDERQIIQPPNSNTRIKMSIHQNDDIKMLWGVKGDVDFSKKFCSVVIECEVSSNGQERWYKSFNEVCAYMDREKKRPNKRDKDPEIKTLGIWISTQIINYKKQTHIVWNNPDVRTEWESYIEKYSEYLDRNSSKKKQTSIPETHEEQKTTTPHQFPPISDIGALHKKYLKMGSDTLHKKFKENPDLWLEYHATRNRTFTAYDTDSIPSNRIVRELEKIQTKREKVIVDMGCGEASIAHHFQNDKRFAFHNYDHQTGGDPLIQEVDISKLPLEDVSVEIAIMSLALWGTRDNCTQYIKEAYRVLESGGKFYISDSTKKWSPEQLTPENGGELLRTLLTTNGFNIINEEIRSPFCLFVCEKIY